MGIIRSPIIKRQTVSNSPKHIDKNLIHYLPKTVLLILLLDATRGQFQNHISLTWLPPKADTQTKAGMQAVVSGSDSWRQGLGTRQAAHTEGEKASAGMDGYWPGPAVRAWCLVLSGLLRSLLECISEPLSQAVSGGRIYSLALNPTGQA